MDKPTTKEDKHMDGYTLALVIIGAGTATSWVFRLIDRIDGRR